MLEALRNASKSWVMKGILIVLAMTFVVFFGTDFGGGGGSSGASSVIEVGDRNFTVQEVSRAFNEEVQQVSARTSQRIDQQTAVNAGLLDQAVSRLVTETLFDQAAKDLGITASIDATAQAIRILPRFQGSTGRFDRALFEAFLQQQAMSEASFVAQTQLDLQRNQYLGSLQNAATSPGLLSDNLYKRRAERRVAEILILPLPAPASIEDPDEAQLAAFYNEFMDAFETPELRSATLATLNPVALAKTIQVPLAELKEAYTSRQDEFQVPETRDIVQATFASRDDAIRAAALIEGGKTFEEASQAVAGLSAVTLEGVTRNSIALSALANAAFALAPNAVSKPLESELGWHLAEVTSITPGRTIPFDEAAPALREELARAKAINRIYDILNDVEDGLAGGATIDEVARESGLVLTKLDEISRGGQTAFGENFDNPALTPKTLARLFAMREVGDTEIVESSDGGFTTVRLDRITAPAVPALTNVRDRVTAAWKEDRAREQVDGTAAKIVERAETGESLETLAREFNASFVRTDPFDRSGQGATVATPLVAPIFEADVNAIVDQPIAEGGAVARVAEIKTADMTAPERKQLRQALASQIANDIINQLAVALQNEIDIDIDRPALKSAFATP
ncbi:MAG: SurA N-terminal domain-containing protein [Alphaproteobacteria bacterium]